MHNILTSFVWRDNNWFLTISVSHTDFHQRFNNSRLATPLFEALIELFIKNKKKRKRKRKLKAILQKFPDSPVDFRIIYRMVGSRQIDLAKKLEIEEEGRCLALTFVIDCPELLVCPRRVPDP